MAGTRLNAKTIYLILKTLMASGGFPAPISAIMRLIQLA